MKPQRHDPMKESDPHLSDCVYRLRRMGHAGNVRVEFPIFQATDVDWAAKILGDTAAQMIQLAQDKAEVPMIRVLRARAIATQMASELKIRTTHRQVQVLPKDV